LESSGVYARGGGSSGDESPGVNNKADHHSIVELFPIMAVNTINILGE
jgi:hypothetical protein